MMQPHEQKMVGECGKLFHRPHYLYVMPLMSCSHCELKAQLLHDELLN